MNTRNANVIFPPSNDPDQPQIVLLINTFLMTFGLLAFAVAFISGLKLLVLYLGDHPDVPPPTIDLLFAQVISLALLFMLGWGISLISIQFLRNRVYPYILVGAGILVSVGMAAIYGRGILKCYNESELNIWKYAVVLFGCYLVLAAFYLLTEKANLRMMVLPLLGVLALHIFLMVFHYIFWGSVNSNFVYLDLGFIAILAILMRLMVALKSYVPLQQALKAFVRVASAALPPLLKALPGPRQTGE